MYRLYSRSWLGVGIVGVVLLVLGVLSTKGVATMAMEDFGPAVVSADSESEVVLVDNIADLLANIGRDNIELIVAAQSTDPGGAYVVPVCPKGVDEVSDPSCGQMQQGDDSVLRSTLELDLDENGVPTSATPEVVLTAGAVIDCSDLPASGLRLSCLVAGDGSTIRNITIINGSQTPEPDPPGGKPDNRNGIMIVAGKEAVVDEVRLINTRRGVLFTTESGKETRGEVRHSLIDGSELAGIFLWVRSPDGDTSNSRLRGEIEANRLTRIGLHPLLYVWAFRGSGNDSHAEFIENIVDSSNPFGITIQGVGSPGSPARGNTASFEIKGGRLEGSQGLTMRMVRGSDNSNNCVVGEVKGLTIENGNPAVSAGLAGWGTGNKFLLEMTDSVYVGETGPGEVRVTDDVGSDFQFSGTPEEFLEDNTNFDISGALLGFGDDGDCD